MRDDVIARALGESGRLADGIQTLYCSRFLIGLLMLVG